MKNAVIETAQDSWKTRAASQFGVRVLSRPHTVRSVEAGEYSCRVLLQGLHEKDRRRLEAFVKREISNGSLAREVSIQRLSSGLQLFVVGRGRSIESTLGEERYLVPRVILNGSIQVTDRTERFAASFLDDSVLHHLLGDISEFAKARIVSESEVEVPEAAVFPPPFASATPKIGELQARILATTLQAGYFDSGSRHTTQEELAKSLKITKRVLNARLRELSKMALTSLLFPLEPTEDQVDAVIDRMAQSSQRTRKARIEQKS